MTRVGCTHNIDRLIKHNPQGVDNEGNVAYVVGDLVTLICPHGCPDIEIEVRTPRSQVWGR